MSRFTESNPITGYTVEEERLKRVEEQVRALEVLAANSAILGRLRTDRTAPTSSTDVQPPDLEYDMVRDDSYQYVLVNNAGTLNWLRWSYSTF